MRSHSTSIFLAFASLTLLSNSALAKDMMNGCTIPRSHYDVFLQKGLYYKEPSGQIYYQVYGVRNTKWIIHSYQNPCFEKYGITLYPQPQ